MSCNRDTSIQVETILETIQLLDLHQESSAELLKILEGVSDIDVISDM